MTGRPRASFRQNVGINMAFAVVPIVLTLISVPLYLQAIGLERYGILTLVWLVTGMFGALDFGMGSATTLHVARGQRDGSRAAMGSAVLTTGAINTALGVVGAVVFVVIVGPLAFGSIRTEDAAIPAELDAAIPAIAALVPVALLKSVLKNALDGQARFLLANSITTFGQVLTILGVLGVAMLVGPELDLLIGAVLLTRVLALAAMIVAVWPLLRGARFMSRAELWGLGKFGGWMSVFGGLSAVTSSADRFMLGWLLGAGATGLYAVPFSLAHRLGFVQGAIQRTLYPRLAGSRDAQDLHALTARALIGTTAIMATITLPAALLAGPFLTLWLGAELGGQMTGLAMVLLYAFWVQAVLRVLFISERAAGRPQTAAYVRLVSTAPYLAALLALIWAFGAMGAAAALAARFGAELAWMLHRTGMWRVFLPGLGVFGGLAALALAAPLLSQDPWLSLGLALALGGASALAGLRLSPDLAAALRAVASFGRAGRRPAE